MGDAACRTGQFRLARAIRSRVRIRSRSGLKGGARQDPTRLVGRTALLAPLDARRYATSSPPVVDGVATAAFPSVDSPFFVARKAPDPSILPGGTLLLIVGDSDAF
jgi:hypothetical protein